VAALVIAGCRPDGDDGAIVVGKNVIAINLPPFVTFGRASQVVRPIVGFLAAIPILLLNAGTFLPLLMLAISAVVVAILRLRLIVAILVRMVLRYRGQASDGRCQDRECKRFNYSIHGFSSTDFDSLDKGAVARSQIYEFGLLAFTLKTSLFSPFRGKR
jgi:hypothetical protein